MKNRTVAGIICISLAVIAAFVLIPVINKNSVKEINVIRISKQIYAGSEITSDCIETVAVPASSLPDGAITDAAQIRGKYALCDMFAGDYIFPAKLTDKTSATSFALLNLEEGEMAVTVEITSFADGFSGQLTNGDVVSLFIYDKASKSVQQLPELMYVSVITTISGKGNSLDTAATDDESLPETLMLRVNARQAALLFGYSNSASVCCAFVCHAEGRDAEKYLRLQADYFTEQQIKNDSGGESTSLSDSQDAGVNSGGTIASAHNIIFGD